MIWNRSAILLEPRFKYANLDGSAHKPTFQETLKELLYVMNASRSSNHSITAINFIFQGLSGIAFIIFFSAHLSTGTTITIILSIFFIGTVYNTIWYHRYCAHASFEFSHWLYPVTFLWTNPIAIIFREETYIVPHRVHHRLTDRPGDPYGPHLGWLASFLAPELYQNFDSTIPQDRYNSLVRSLRHVGLRTQSYAWFKKTGCIESIFHYGIRIIFSQFFWVLLFAMFGGVAYVTAFYAAIFISTVLIRDFNWRGHGGNYRLAKRESWEYDASSRALNQHFYGYIASEWHDNHHKYPFSANNGFLPGQIDIAFLLIKLMHRLGIVESYVDAKPLFEKECLGLPGNQSVMVGKP